MHLKLAEVNTTPLTKYEGCNLVVPLNSIKRPKQLHKSAPLQ